jgi:hypothetical protein
LENFDMIVIEQYSEIQIVQVGVDEWGEPILEERRVEGRREVDVPDVITPEEAIAREAATAPARQRSLTLSDLRTMMQKLIVARALGADVDTRIAQVRSAFQALSPKDDEVIP